MVRDRASERERERERGYEKTFENVVDVKRSERTDKITNFSIFFDFLFRLVLIYSHCLVRTVEKEYLQSES